jgi:uncharacterized protein
MPEAITPQAPPLPKPHTLRQFWRDLSFLHWAIDPDAIAHLYPPGVRPDVFEGRSYVGLVPFEMAHTGFARGPAVFGTFLETNVRVYSADSTGRRGVVFLSLDTNRLDMVVGARSVVGVPYRWAAMTHHERDGRHRYESRLRWPGVRAASAVEVQAGDRLTAGPLEHFLTARWGAHLRRAGRSWYMPNAHPEWPLRSAELIALHDDGLFASVGLPALGDRPPDHVMFSDGVPARFGLPVRASTPRE